MPRLCRQEKTRGVGRLHRAHDAAPRTRRRRVERTGRGADRHAVEAAGAFGRADPQACRHREQGGTGARAEAAVGADARHRDGEDNEAGQHRHGAGAKAHPRSQAAPHQARAVTIRCPAEDTDQVGEGVDRSASRPRDPTDHRGGLRRGGAAGPARCLARRAPCRDQQPPYANPACQRGRQPRETQEDADGGHNTLDELIGSRSLERVTADFHRCDRRSKTAAPPGQTLPDFFATALCKRE